MASEKLCDYCAKKIQCQVDASCWCNDLPKVISPDDTKACLCQECLIKSMASIVNNYKTLTADQKASISAIGMSKSPELNVDYYMERGLLVMTRWYHLRRGHCCDNGCKHCPY